MNEQQLWHKTTKSLMPPNRHCVKNKWVFKIKRNGMYRACLVACGYSQVQGINFSENYSPVVNDVTFCIMLLMVLHFGYLAKIVNVKTTFLYGDLEEEIYMECLQGMADVKKGWLHHLKKIHLWPHSISSAIIKKGHRKFWKVQVLKEAVLTYAFMLREAQKL